MSFSKNQNELVFHKTNISCATWTISVPSSKSLTNRAIHLASLGKGKTLLQKPLTSIDTETMKAAWSALGAKIFEHNLDLEILGINGFRDGNPHFPSSIFVSNAGTVARFLTAVLSLSDSTIEITGDPYMDERPLGGLIQCLEKLEAQFSFRGKYQCTPFFLTGSKSLPKERVFLEVPGNVSSQYLSALMMATPLLPHGCDLHYEKNIVSLPYVQMTKELMESFSVEVSHDEEKGIFSIENGVYERDSPYEVEVDFSSASYFLVLAAIHGTRVRIPRAKKESLQGDRRIVHYLEEMGCAVRWDENGLLLEGRKGELIGLERDLKNETDLVPALAAAAIFAKTPSCFKNISHMKFKECDRLAVLSCELSKLGAKVFEKDGNLYVFPKNHYSEALLDPHGDHRMAMAFAVVGTLIPGLKLLNPDCVAKTFPSFFEELRKVICHPDEPSLSS